MKRRDFFVKSGCGMAGLMLAHFGLTSCKKKEEKAASPSTAQKAPVQELSRKDMIENMLIDNMGKSQEEATQMIAEFEKMLPMVQEKCICKTCPTYVAEETKNGFCHPLVGKSKIITEEKGCDCPKCPVYIEKKMKNGYYCTRQSEMEQEMAKMA